MRHLIAILLQNEAGALTRVTGLISTRGYNIESLSVAPTNDPTVSRKGLEDLMDEMTKIGDTEGKVPFEKLAVPGITKIGN